MLYEIGPFVLTTFVGGAAVAAGWKTYSGVVHEGISYLLTQVGQRLHARES